MNRRKRIDASVKRDPKDRASANRDAKKSNSNIGSSSSNPNDDKSLSSTRTNEADDITAAAAMDKSMDLRNKIPKLSRTITQDTDDPGTVVVHLEGTRKSSLSLVDPSYGDPLGVETFDYSHGTKGEKLPGGSIDPDVEVAEALKKLFPSLTSNLRDEADLRTLIEQQRDVREDEERSKKGAMSFRDSLLAYSAGEKDVHSKRKDSGSSKSSKDKYSHSSKKDDHRDRSGKRKDDDKYSRSKKRDKSPSSPSGFDLGRPFFSASASATKEADIDMSDSTDLRAALKELAYLRSIQKGEYGLPKEEEDYFRKMNDLSKTSLGDLLEGDDKQRESTKKRKLESDFKSPPSRSLKSRKDSEDLETSESKWEKVIDKFIDPSSIQKEDKRKSSLSDSVALPGTESAYGPALPPGEGTLYSDIESSRRSVDRLSNDSKKEKRSLEDSSPPFSKRGAFRGDRGRGRGERGRGERGRGDRARGVRGRGRGRGDRGRGIDRVRGRGIYRGRGTYRGFRGRGTYQPMRGRHIFGSSRRRSSSSSSSSYSSRSRSRSRDRGRSSRRKRHSRSRSSSYSSYSSRSRSRSCDRSRGRAHKRSRRRSRSDSSDSSSRSRSRDRSRRRSRSVSKSRKGTHPSNRRSKSRSWSFDEDYTERSSKGKVQKKDGKSATSKASNAKTSTMKDAKGGNKAKPGDKTAKSGKESKDTQRSTDKASQKSSKGPEKAKVPHTEKAARSAREKDIPAKSDIKKAAPLTGVFLPRTVTKTIKTLKLPPGRNLKGPAHPAFRVPVDEEDEDDVVPLRKASAKTKKEETVKAKDDIAQNAKFRSIFESEVDKVFGRKEDPAAQASVKEEEVVTAVKEEPLVKTKEKQWVDDAKVEEQLPGQESEKDKEKSKKEKKKKDKEERKRKKEKKEKKKKKKSTTDMFSSGDDKRSKDEQYDEQSLESGDQVSLEQGYQVGLEQPAEYQEYYQEGTEYYEQGQEQGWYDETGVYHPYQEGEVYYYDEQGNIVEGYEGGQVYGEEGQAVAVQGAEGGEVYYGEEQAYPAEQVYVEGEGEAQYTDEQAWDPNYVQGAEAAVVEGYGYETYPQYEGQEYVEGEQYASETNTLEGAYGESYVEAGQEEWYGAEATYTEGGEEYAEYQYDASQEGEGEFMEQEQSLPTQEGHWDQHHGGEETYASVADPGAAIPAEKPQVIEYGHSGYGHIYADAEAPAPVLASGSDEVMRRGEEALKRPLAEQNTGRYRQNRGQAPGPGLAPGGDEVMRRGEEALKRTHAEQNTGRYRQNRAQAPGPGLAPGGDEVMRRGEEALKRPLAEQNTGRYRQNRAQAPGPGLAPGGDEVMRRGEEAFKRTLAEQSRDAARKPQESSSRPLKSILKKSSFAAPKTGAESQQSSGSSDDQTKSVQSPIGENIGPEYIVRLADHGSRQFYCNLCNCYIASLITKELHAKSIKHVELFVRAKSSLLHSVIGTKPTQKEEVLPSRGMMPGANNAAAEAGQSDQYSDVYGQPREYEERERRYSGGFDERQENIETPLNYDEGERRYSESYEDRQEDIETPLNYDERRMLYRASLRLERPNEEKEEEVPVRGDERPDNKGWPSDKEFDDSVNRLPAEREMSARQGQRSWAADKPFQDKGRNEPKRSRFSDYSASGRDEPQGQESVDMDWEPAEEDRLTQDQLPKQEPVHARGDSHRPSPLRTQSPMDSEKSKSQPQQRQPHQDPNRRSQPSNERSSSGDRRRPPEHSRSSQQQRLSDQKPTDYQRSSSSTRHSESSTSRNSASSMRDSGSSTRNASSSSRGSGKSSDSQNRSQSQRQSSSQNNNQRRQESQSKPSNNQRSETPTERGRTSLESKDSKRVRESEEKRSSSPSSSRTNTPDTRREIQISTKQQGRPPALTLQEIKPLKPLKSPTEKKEMPHGGVGVPRPASRGQASILGEPSSEVQSSAIASQPSSRGRGMPLSQQPSRGRGMPSSQQPSRGRGIPASQQPSRGRGIPAAAGGRGAQRGRGVPPPPPPRGGGRGGPQMRGGRGSSNAVPTRVSKPQVMSAPVPQSTHSQAIPSLGSVPRQGILSSLPSSQPQPHLSQAAPPKPFFGGMLPSPPGAFPRTGSVLGPAPMGAVPRAGAGLGILGVSPGPARGRGIPQYQAQSGPPANIAQNAIQVSTGRGAHHQPRGGPRGRAAPYPGGNPAMRGRGGQQFRGRGAHPQFRGRGRGGRGGPPMRGRGQTW